MVKGLIRFIDFHWGQLKAREYYFVSIYFMIEVRVSDLINV